MTLCRYDTTYMCRHRTLSLWRQADNINVVKTNDWYVYASENVALKIYNYNNN